MNCIVSHKKFARSTNKLITLVLIGLFLIVASDNLMANSKYNSLIPDCSIPPNLITERPNTGNKPTEIGLGVFLIDIIDIEELNNSFKADITVDLSWMDPRLARASLGKSLHGCRLELRDIWHPNAQAISLRDKPKFWFKELTVNDDGKVVYYLRAQAKFTSRFDLREFPFDTQSLIMKFVSFDYGPADVIFIIDENTSGRLGDLDLAGWHFVSNFTDTNVKPITASGEQRTRVNHVIVLERKAGYYIWKFVVPLCFIVLMAGSVFWLDPESFAPQIGISTAAVFTLVAFLLGLRQGLPQVAYLTRMDELILAATVLVFFSFGEVVLASRLANNGKIELARKVDWHARWTYLVAFIGLVYIILIVPNIS